MIRIELGGYTVLLHAYIYIYTYIYIHTYMHTYIYIYITRGWRMM